MAAQKKRKVKLTETSGENLLIFSSLEELGYLAASHILSLSAQAVRARGRFTIALSGGSLPKLLTPALVSDPISHIIDWPAWHVFWADERCVPLDDPNSNYRLAQENIFGVVDIPSTQIYAVETTLKATAAAAAYQKTLTQVFQPGADQIPRFDLILLGLGEDGHTASLFPNHLLLEETKRWVAPIFDSPKPPPQRVTLTLPLINQARHIAFLATGASKADILPQILKPQAGAVTLPAARVQPSDGDVRWFVDEPAAMNLK